MVSRAPPVITFIAKGVGLMAHDRKVVGSNPVTGILDVSGVKATQVQLIHPARFF